MAVGINIISDFDTKGISKAISEFSKLESASEKAQFALKKAALPAAAALAGIATAAGFAVKAAIEDQAEQAKLAQVLKQVTGATKTQVAEVEKQISSFMKVSTFTDGELRPALANLVQGTKDVTESQKLLALAMDIAVATGTPLITITDALAKAENGNLMALKKLTPAITENIKEGATLDQIYQQLTATFGGAALDATKTTAGQFALLKNSANELKESFGATLLPVVNLLIPVLQNLVGVVENNQFIFGVFAAAVSVLSSAILLANGYLKLNAAYQSLMRIETVKNMLATQAATAIQTGFATATGLAVKGLGFLAAALAIQYAWNTFSGHAREADENLNQLIITTSKFSKQGGSSTQDIIRDFSAMAVHIGSKADFMGSVMFKRLGREFTLLADGAEIDIEHLDQAFSDVANKSPEYAQKIVDALRAQAEATPTNVRAYKDLTDAANRYQKQLDLTSNAQNALNGAITGLSFSKTSAGFRSASAHSLEFTARMKGAANMQDFFNKKTSSGGAAVETAIEKLNKYIDAVKGVTSAQRSLRDANKSVDESNKSLLEKTKALTQAQKRFNLVTKGYGKESKEAKDADEERSKAERAAERAKYALEEAIFAVKDAEAELIKVRKDPESTPQMIREAEIRLAQAKLSVADATDQQRDSVEALTAAQEKLDVTINGVKEGSDAYNEVLKELEDAEKAQTDAIYSRVQAYERLKDATDALTQAEKERAEAGKKITKAQKAAADANAVVVVPDLDTGDGSTGVDFGFGEITFEDLKNIRVPTLEELIGGGMGTFANGGIVTKAMLGLVGEAGAEAIIPLDRMGSMGSTYNIQVTAGMGADGKDIGTQIVNALKRYERTNGALPLTVA